MDKASKRQQEIIESAGKLLMEKGIKGLTTKNLAQEMEFSESALYRHFKNKEDIILLFIRFLSVAKVTNDSCNKVAKSVLEHITQ